MTILLTGTGFENILGATVNWTNFADFVYGASTDATPAVAVAPNVVAASLGGNDYISGVSLATGEGILIGGELQTNQGADLVIGYSAGGTGLSLVAGTLGTGQGSDKVVGQGFSIGISVDADSAILTKAGADVIVANATSAGGVGLFNQGTIEMDVSGVDEGIDILQAGGGDTGLVNAGTITFGAGADTLAAVSTGLDFYDLINVGGTIRMGAGADTLVAGGTGIALGGEVFLGDGADTFFGFGEDMVVDAGNGVNDTLVLPTEVGGIGTPLAYVVQVDSVAGTVTFTSSVFSGSMETLGFEFLTFGGTTVDIASLSTGDIIS